MTLVPNEALRFDFSESIVNQVIGTVYPYRVSKIHNTLSYGSTPC